jgi:hypothetical protein
MTVASRTSRIPPAQAGSTRAAGRRKTRAWPAALFFGLVACSAAPLWTVAYLPTLDGPSHLYVADLALRLQEEGTARLHAVFELHDRIEANFIIYPLLWLFLQIAPAATAEKLLVTTYVAAFAFAGLYMVRCLNPEDRMAAFLLLPAIYTNLFALGFYNLSFGIAAFMLFLGFWWRHQGEASLRVAAGYGLLAGLAYLSHLFALSMIGLAVTVLSIAWLARARAAGGERARPAVLARGFLVRTATPALTALPLWLAGMLMVADGEAFVDAQPDLEGLWPSMARMLVRAMTLFSGAPVMTHGGVCEQAAAAGFVGLLLFLAVVRARGRPEATASPLFALAVLLWLLFLTVPSRLMIGWLDSRLAPFAVVVLIAWLAATGRQAQKSADRRLGSLGHVAAIAPVAAVTLIVLTATAGRIERFGRLDALIGDYVSAASAIEPGSTILPLRLLPPAGIEATTEPGLFLNTVGYVAARTGGIDLRNWHLKSASFPVRYRAEADPYDHLGTAVEFASGAPGLAPSRYAEATGIAVDYILFWGDYADPPLHSPLGAELAAAYELAYVSPSGLMHVFERVGGGDAP